MLNVTEWTKVCMALGAGLNFELSSLVIFPKPWHYKNNTHDRKTTSTTIGAYNHMKIQLPPKVKKITDTLTGAGHEAYVVGGCVRDSLLGRDPQDWDITTSAKPQQVKDIFARTIDTGIQHGTVTVMMDHEGFEVTTYRIDGEYEDSRHPSKVTFTRNLAEDLRRRDFTINAMAYNEQDGLVDMFDGIGDMERKIIRCVGEPKERFTEDALRMLRAVRFGAQLGFAIEDKTKAAIAALAPTLKNISAERIQVELVKLLVSDHPQEVRTLFETGISREIFPWLDDMMKTEQKNPHHCHTVGEHTIETLKNIPADKVLRLTMLLHDIAKPRCKTQDEAGVYHFFGHPKEGAQMAGEVLRKLKFDNDTVDRVTSLVLWHDDNPPAKPVNIRRAIHRIGERQFPDLFLVKRADILGQSSYQQEKKLAYLAAYEACYREIQAAEVCISRKDLAVKGNDLIAAGMRPGKAIGEALAYLLDLVLEHPEYNRREILMEKLSERA